MNVQRPDMRMRGVVDDVDGLTIPCAGDVSAAEVNVCADGPEVSSRSDMIISSCRDQDADLGGLREGVTSRVLLSQGKFQSTDGGTFPFSDAFCSVTVAYSVNEARQQLDQTWLSGHSQVN